MLALSMVPSQASAGGVDGPGTIRTTGEVVEIVEQALAPDVGPMDAYQVVRVLTVPNAQGDRRLVTARLGETVAAPERVLRVGDRVHLSIVAAIESPTGTEEVYVTDIVRIPVILLLAALFVLVILAVGLLRGLRSLLALVLVFVVVFGALLPALLSGAPPLFVTMLAGAAILAISLLITHGLRRSTVLALVSTIGGLLITGVLAHLFTIAARISGLTSDEATLLQVQNGLSLDMRGLLLSGMILGALGVLDDVAITQVETVQELSDVNPSLKPRELFVRAMRIGRHHIASVVNTLVLAYTGAALPLLLLFLTTDQGIFDLINAEFMAEEIVRTLVGTIGLILTVPIATWFASAYGKRKYEHP